MAGEAPAEADSRWRRVAHRGCLIGVGALLGIVLGAAWGSMIDSMTADPRNVEWRGWVGFLSGPFVGLILGVFLGTRRTGRGFVFALVGIALATGLGLLLTPRTGSGMDALTPIYVTAVILALVGGILGDWSTRRAKDMRRASE